MATADVAVERTPRFRSTATVRNLDLVRELAITQFKLKYTGSVLGYVWSLLKPLMLFGVMYEVFGHLFHQDQYKDFPIQLLVGIVIWNFFGETTGTAMSSIASNGHLIRKASFPRVILVIASSLTALFTFLINIALIIIVAAPLHGMDLGLRTLTVPLFLLELYVFTLGVSMLLASLFVFFRDLGHIWEVASLVLFYGSAVVYLFDTVIPKSVKPWASVNPIAQIIEDMRHALVTPTSKWMYGIVGWPSLLAYAVVVLAVGLGLFAFNRLSPRFAEEL